MHASRILQVHLSEKNFLYLNGKNVLYPRVAEIISEFTHENEKHYNKLRNKLSQFRNIFQFIYSNVYPEIYCSTESCSSFYLLFVSKAHFTLSLKLIRTRKKLEKMAKILRIIPLKEINHLLLNKNQ